jgi:protein HIRA/HIR1
LSVRWSPDGQFLASGSDDTKIVIWQFDPNAKTSFGANPTPENYRPIRVLMGHDSDVADLQWSPNQEFIASCGFDSKVCIWDGRTFDRITTITTHTAFVKGIAWDPAGSFLATQVNIINKGG